MAENYYRLLAYWENRKETAEACAARFARMVGRLAELEPCFAGWYKQAWRPSAAHKRFCKMPPDPAELTRIFERNLEHYESPRVPWPELGFTVGAWTGLKEDYAASLLVHSGAYDDQRQDPNNVFISLPNLRLGSDEPWTATALKPVLMAVVEAWDARFAGIIGNRSFDALPRNPAPAMNNLPWFPWAGWVTWLAPPAALRVTPPPGIDAQRLPGGGLLVALSEAPFDIGDPADRAAAAAMHQALRGVQR